MVLPFFGGSLPDVCVGSEQLRQEIKKHEISKDKKSKLVRRINA